MKRCNRCKIEKDEECFSKNKKAKDGLQGECRECFRIRSAATKEHRKEVAHQWYLKNREEKLKRNKEYKEENKEQEKKRNQRWLENNRDRHYEFMKLYLRDKRQDASFRTIDNLRCLIVHSLTNKGFSKTSRAAELLGCSFEEFLSFIGCRPDDTYHLDHICPIAQATSLEEAEKLQHYSNLRWLPAEENLSKSDNWTPEGEEMCRKLLGREWIHHKGTIEDAKLEEDVCR